MNARMIRKLLRFTVGAALAVIISLTAFPVLGAGIHTEELQVGKALKGTLIHGIYFGTGTLSSGVLVVSNTNVKAGSLIFVDRQTVAGTSGGNFAITRTAGTSFTLTSLNLGALTTQTLDTSIVAWMMITP